MTARRTCTWLLLATLIGCGVPDHDPSETVRRHLDAMANDPIRTLALTTQAFHAAHGLRFEQVGDQPFAGGPGTVTRFDDDALELERARFGWLTVLTKRFFVIQSGRFTSRVENAQLDGDRARVVVRVEGKDDERPALEVTFQLVRGAGDRPWRIDGVVVPEIDDRSLGAAFLVAPNAALHARIGARRRGSR